MYIALHVPALYSQIRNRALIQYFRWVPWPVVSLVSPWSLYSTIFMLFQPLLVSWYEEDGCCVQHFGSQPGRRINAVDSGWTNSSSNWFSQQGNAVFLVHSQSCFESGLNIWVCVMDEWQILYAKDTDQRSTTFKKSLQMGKQYARNSHQLILRAAVIKHHIQVKVSVEFALRIRSSQYILLRTLDIFVVRIIMKMFVRRTEFETTTASMYKPPSFTIIILRKQ